MPMKKFKKHAAMWLGLALGTLVQAQETPAETGPQAISDTTRTLPTVETRARLNETTEHSGSYTAGGVSIGKATRSLRQTPQSVTVITRHRLDDQHMRNVDDALLNAPGVVAEYQSSTERNFYSRGFVIDQVQMDGVPTVRGSGFSTSYDLAAFDHVEILRGPAGLFNGAGQPGGTINLVRKRPVREARQYQFKAERGRWNFSRAEADTSLPLNHSGTLRTRWVAAYEDREYFYDFADSAKQVLYGIIEADLGPRTVLGGGVNYERNDSTPFYTGLPRYSNGADLGLPRSSYTNGGWSRSDIKNTTWFVDLHHQFNANWRLKLAASRLRENNQEVTGAGFGAIDPLTGTGFRMSAFDQSLQGKQTVLDGYLTGHFDAWGRQHELVFGGNWQKLERDIDVDIFNYDPWSLRTKPTEFSRPASNTTLSREQTGVYGYLRLALAAHTRLTAGGRISDWETSTRDNLTGTFRTQPYKEHGAFTSYAALEQDVANWTAYLSRAEIFESQAHRFTANGQRLTPAIGNNVELGIKGELSEGRLNSALALFRTLQENRAQQDPQHPDPCPGNPTGTGACYIADGKVRSQGLDAEITGALTPRWQMAAGYTFNTTRYLRDRTATGEPSANEHQPLSTFTPKHLLRLWSAYRLGPGAWQGWMVGAGVNVQTRMYKVNSRAGIRVEQGTYAVWNARVSWQASANVLLALNASNLFDKHYYRTIGTSTSNWYGEPRNVTLSMQAVF